MSIYTIIDKCPLPIGAHLVHGHVKEGNAKFNAEKSYFTDESGNAVAFEPAVQLLIKAKDAAARISTLSKDHSKSITNVNGTVHAIKADPGKYGFAVSWGKRVGTDGDTRGECKWICLFVTTQLTGGRHQWVTAYPATENYVTRHKV